MDDNEYTETFELSRFIPDATFDEVINRFENGRTINKLKPRNPLISLEDFVKDIPKKETKNKEQLKEHLEKLEKQIEEEHTN